MMKHLFGGFFVLFSAAAAAFGSWVEHHADNTQKNMKILLTSHSFVESEARKKKGKTKQEEERHKKSYKFAFNQICFLCFAKKAEKRKNILFQFQYIKNLFRLR
jgi:hypothetical protein